MAVDPKWLGEQIDRFVDVRPRYVELARLLERVLTAEVLPRFPLARIQARPKGVASYAFKILKKCKYQDPVHEITDLCGIRVVMHLLSEVEEVGRSIERAFVVRPEHSFDASSRLASDQFGYRSVHKVVEIREGKPAGVTIPRRLAGLFAEIQVRTIAQHAWSDIGHDRLYKAQCQVPEVWKREAARAAALLESADQSFAMLVQGLSAYEAQSVVISDPPDCPVGIEQLREIARRDPVNPAPALQRARLAMARQDWDQVLAAVREYQGPEDALLLACAGEATCRKAKGERRATAWRRGIAALEKAAALETAGVEPHLRLADLHAVEDSDLALEHYRAAFELDPSSPAALQGYVLQKMRKERTTAFIPLLRPTIEDAIRRSRDLAAAGVDIPPTLYRIAGFLQLLGPERERESLAALAWAVHETGAATTALEAALGATTLAAELEPGRRDIECARRFLLLARHVKSAGARKRPLIRTLATRDAPPIRGPVVIVAGGCDPFHEDQMRTYREMLDAAFADHSGTLISGGTRQGISGVVGELGKKLPRALHTIGYLPATLPADGTATRDERYHELRNTTGKGQFSALEPLQNWIDVLCSGIDPGEVRVLGINGGDIAGLEYRFALALRAKVTVIAGSGREAVRLLAEWPPAPRSGLTVIPNDPMTLRAFLRRGEKGLLRDQQIEKGARAQHEGFLKEHRYKNLDPAMRPWPKLGDGLRESNRDQIRYIESILRSAGYRIGLLAKGRGLRRFPAAAVERMAEMEHGRWNVERLQDGWTLGPRDPAKKRSPYLVPWHELSEEVKSYDRKNVLRWPDIIRHLGMAIHPLVARNAATVPPRRLHGGASRRRRSPARDAKRR